jgi:hypothetical protein
VGLQALGGLKMWFRMAVGNSRLIGQGAIDRLSGD